MWLCFCYGRLPSCFKMSGLYLGIRPDTWIWTKWLSVWESLNLVCLLSKKCGLLLFIYLFSDWGIYCFSYCSSLVVLRTFHFCLQFSSLHRYILFRTVGTRSPSAFCPRWVNAHVSTSYWDRTKLLAGHAPSPCLLMAGCTPSIWILNHLAFNVQYPSFLPRNSISWFLFSWISAGDKPDSPCLLLSLQGSIQKRGEHNKASCYSV